MHNNLLRVPSFLSSNNDVAAPVNENNKNIIAQPPTVLVNPGFEIFLPTNCSLSNLTKFGTIGLFALEVSFIVDLNDALSTHSKTLQRYPQEH